MKFKAKISKEYIILFSVVSVLFLIPLISSIFFKELWFIIFSIILFVLIDFILVSSVFGYARLDEDGIYIKFDLFFHKFIPYTEISGFEKKHGLFIAGESLLSIWTATDHVIIQYNPCHSVSLSIQNIDDFIVCATSKIEEVKKESQD